MKRKSLILAILMCLPVGVLLTQELQSRRPGIASSCPDWVLSRPESETRFIHPEKVVVEPWQGRHNVFATFKVPDGYKPDAMFVVTIQDSNPYCGHTISRSRPGKSSDRQVFGLFRTRTTLWLLSKGQINQLEQPSNWKLAIFKES